MEKRLQLHEILKTFVTNVYYQPPSTLIMSYPCIRYCIQSGDTIFANNKPYIFRTGYTVIYIDKNPDSDIPGKLAMLPMCSFDSRYTADNLNHTVFKLYY
jgi:hypothetical protein